MMPPPLVLTHKQRQHADAEVETVEHDIQGEEQAEEEEPDVDQEKMHIVHGALLPSRLAADCPMTFRRQFARPRRRGRQAEVGPSVDNPPGEEHEDYKQQGIDEEKAGGCEANALDRQIRNGVARAQEVVDDPGLASDFPHDPTGIDRDIAKWDRRHPDEQQGLLPADRIGS